MMLDHLLFDVEGPKHNISVSYFPGASGFLTGLKDTLFQKKIYCALEQSTKQVEKWLKPQKSFSLGSGLQLFPPLSLWDDSYAFTFPALHMASAATHLV